MKCISCKINKQKDDFSFRNKSLNKKQHYCKECKKIYNKRWYQKHTDEQKVRCNKNKNKQREVLRKIINKLKSVPCVDCKKIYIPEAMDFDHVTGNKIAAVSHLAFKKGVPIKYVLEEISKCEVVCAVCHRIRTATRRICTAS